MQVIGDSSENHLDMNSSDCSNEHMSRLGNPRSNEMLYGPLIMISDTASARA